MAQSQAQLAAGQTQLQTAISNLTTTAANFFLRFGFQPISRAEFPLTAQASVEFQEVCTATATGMSLMLEEVPC